MTKLKIVLIYKSRLNYSYLSIFICSLNFNASYEAMEMRDVKNLEAVVVDDNIWEVPIEQIAEICLEYNFKTIAYEKTKKGEMLIVILVRTGDRMLQDGNFLSRTIITNVLYSFVNGYKSLLVYDHVNKFIEYTDGKELNRYESTHLFAVTRYPHFLNKKAAEHIVRKLEGKT